MRGGKKIIGVCVTKVHSVGLSEYLFYLQNAAISAGYKLIIFNSTEDFFYKGDNEKGAVSVYKLINYDIIDALVVYYENFRDHAVADNFINDAKAHDTPVVVLKGSVEGCYCIINEYTEGFKQGDETNCSIFHENRSVIVMRIKVSWLLRGDCDRLGKGR